MFILRYISWVPLLLVLAAFITTLIVVFGRRAGDGILPCDYYNSIDISNGTRQSDSSIIYNNIVYNVSEFAETNYIKDASGDWQRVEKHIRGCLCTKKDKPCVRLCRLYEDTKHKVSHTIFNTKTNATDRKLLHEHFNFLHEMTCDKPFPQGEHKLLHVNTRKITIFAQIY